MREVRTGDGSIEGNMMENIFVAAVLAILALFALRSFLGDRAMT